MSDRVTMTAGRAVDWDFAATVGAKLARPAPASSDYTRNQVIEQLSTSEWQRVNPRSGQGWILFRRRSSVPNANSTSSPT